MVESASQRKSFRFVSWTARLSLGGFFGIFSGIFVGLLLESAAGSWRSQVLLALAAGIMAGLCLRALRAGLFISNQQVICRRLFDTKAFSIKSVRAAHLVPFAGFFIANSLRSVALAPFNGPECRMALLSGRPRRMSRDARLFNACLRAERRFSVDD